MEGHVLGVNATSEGPVLVVNDDGPIRTLYTGVLRQAGLPTLEARNGKEAIDLIARHHVAAVLLDAEMPGMDGLEALRVLRERPKTRTLPVVLLAQRSEVADRVAGLQAGASDYLVTPVDLNELVARVQAQLRGQAAWLQVVSEQARDRAAVTEALRRVRVEPTPELTATGICRELVRLRYLNSAALVAFTREGEVLPLAVRSHLPLPIAVGCPLPPHLARALRACAEEGPWLVERGDPQLRRASALPLADETAPFAAYAPLRSHGALVGLLAVAANPAALDQADTRDQHLALAIDFAALASALLAPALEERGSTERARAELEWVLCGGAFSPVFQPIQEVETGKVVGYEALTRFADGSPAEPRFAEAVQVGMGLEIEAATIAAAIRAATVLPDDVWLSLNVSPAFLLEGDHILRAVQSSSRPLVLELTEHDPIDDYHQMRTAVDRLGSTVQLSIDDAGTGYACLNHVLALQPEFVKLDRHWVRGIDVDPARQALIAGLELFASCTGCRIIAEGVETPEELAALERLNVPLAQGFLIGHPVPVPPAQPELQCSTTARILHVNGNGNGSTPNALSRK